MTHVRGATVMKHYENYLKQWNNRFQAKVKSCLVVFKKLD